MNVDYLEKEIIPQRKKEIEEGKNLSTIQPIYVVLDLMECFISGHTDITSITNNKGLEMEWGYIDQALDLDDSTREFMTSNDGMDDPYEVTRFFIDRVVAFFLTSKAAHEYLEYQKHNLTNGYVYVFYSGYRNHQMDKLLGNE